MLEELARGEDPAGGAPERARGRPGDARRQAHRADGRGGAAPRRLRERASNATATACPPRPRANSPGSEAARSRAERDEASFGAVRDRSASLAAAAGCGSAHAEAMAGWDTDPGRSAPRHRGAGRRPVARPRRTRPADGRASPPRRTGWRPPSPKRNGCTARCRRRPSGSARRRRGRRAGAAELLEDVHHLPGRAGRDPGGRPGRGARGAGGHGRRRPTDATRPRPPWTTPPARPRRRSAAASPNAESRLRAERAAETSLLEEIERLESGGHDVPPVPHTRTASREGRPGAPLWKVVDFADAVPGDHRAGLEAALEASGILDAWVTPDGALLGEDDTFALAGGARAGAVVRAACCVPPIDRADPGPPRWRTTRCRPCWPGSASGRARGPGSRWTAAGRTACSAAPGARTPPTSSGEGAREAARRARIARLRDDTRRDPVAGSRRCARNWTRWPNAGRRWPREHRAVPPRHAPLREAHVSSPASTAGDATLAPSTRAPSEVATRPAAARPRRRGGTGRRVRRRRRPARPREPDAGRGARGGRRLPAGAGRAVARRAGRCCRRAETARDAAEELEHARERLGGGGGAGRGGARAGGRRRRGAPGAAGDGGRRRR